MDIHDNLLRLLLLALVVPSGLASAQDDPPVDVGLEEQVEVQLVLIDTVVLDRKGRTVPDLTKDDFDVIAGGRPVEIATLDVDCPLGRADEPRPGAYWQKHKRFMPRPPVGTTTPRRIVLVFDYAHLSNVYETVEFVLEAIDDHRVGGEEHMIVALGGSLRVELPFTSDHEVVRAALRRMRDDPRLYFGNHRSATLFPYFERLQALLTLLERVPGRKTIVMYSGAFGSDRFFHDREFQDVAAQATRSRSMIYAVDTAGLTVGGSILGPPMLRRLAIESGGRMTAGTNDLTLGYARAQRDAGCIYTLGFYDERAALDERRRLAIYVRGSGYRVVHSGQFVIRSTMEKRRALRDAAYLAPELFESPEVRPFLELDAPVSSRKWNARFEVEIHLPPAALSDPTEWELLGFFRRESGTLIKAFTRKLELAAGADGPVLVSEPVKIRHGRYRMSAVLSNIELAEPFARTLEVTVPRPP